MRVNVICSDWGWIYEKFINEIKARSKNNILINEEDQSKFDIVHFIPYYAFDKNISNGKKSTAWMSHQESKMPLKQTFVDVARNVSTAISHSKKYADILKKVHNLRNVEQIIPGVDLNLFERRDTIRPINKKLIVGYVGRQYTSSNRKNPNLIKYISDLPFVDFRVTGGSIKENNMPAFYHAADLIVSPSLVEGGSMAIQESLACGTPVVCFEGVGVVEEFSHGLIKVPFNNGPEFLSRLDIIWKTKSYLSWREAARMNQMRKQVLQQTWDRFVKHHDRIWSKLCV